MADQKEECVVKVTSVDIYKDEGLVSHIYKCQLKSGKHVMQGLNNFRLRTGDSQGNQKHITNV